MTKFPIIYWLPNMHKTLYGLGFIVAFKSCATKTLSSIVSKVFKVIHHHVKNFYNKTQFYSSFKKIWILQNSFPITDVLNKRNVRKKPKQLQPLTSAYFIIQFRWQLETTNSRFWLVNILLLKFHTLSEKEMKMIKTQILWWKTTKKCKKNT